MRKTEYKYYVIYSLTPAAVGSDAYRLVEIFDNKADAEYVLLALEKVNILFHCYQIVEETLDEIKAEKVVKQNEKKI